LSATSSIGPHEPRPLFSIARRRCTTYEVSRTAESSHVRKTRRPSSTRTEKPWGSCRPERGRKRPMPTRRSAGGGGTLETVEGGLVPLLPLLPPLPLVPLGPRQKGYQLGHQLAARGCLRSHWCCGWRPGESRGLRRASGVQSRGACLGASRVDAPVAGLSQCSHCQTSHSVPAARTWNRPSQRQRRTQSASGSKTSAASLRAKWHAKAKIDSPNPLVQGIATSYLRSPRHRNDYSVLPDSSGPSPRTCVALDRPRTNCRSAHSSRSLYLAPDEVAGGTSMSV
jgi:hypothetical protein